jgi:hypothetical protein
MPPFQFLKIHFNITLPSTPGPSKVVSFPQVSQSNVSAVVVMKYMLLLFFGGGGAYQHYSHEGLLYSNSPNGVSSFISIGVAHQAA